MEQEGGLCDGKEVDQFHQPSGSNEVAIANEDGISYGSELIEVDKVKINQGDLLFGGDASDGALWDIFWRQDVPKLQEYLKKNFREFRYVHCCRLKQLDHANELSNSLKESANINTVWASLIVEECTRLGLMYLCIAPGSRPSPVAVAVASHKLITCISCFDERSLAYHAVGYGRGSHIPAVAITSSGTAVSNLLPASPKKVNLVAALVRGMLVKDASMQLESTIKRAAKTVYQVKEFHRRDGFEVASADKMAKSCMVYFEMHLSLRKKVQ
ncbi:2-succinyl-5-enolpyruvyl-6-hydroxy-3-cyclohexene-1-carboxylate synthase isoform X3 [Glycine max]|uniref:2-succinyl-5-enolpyruvyl-6-hydroxy-3- cyclohexene-1-carboxylate synthase isoform X3 n=1 Tax=Glycine max TaxID=3847 RepID=UPI000719105E|nr:2-succinyl-5-enolpyruvyl-6-hydroxy-3-cyclohexene-1-carboxylate synthase-like isoform X3 [Glycine max]